MKAGDTALYEIIMRRYNQRILRGDAESEDVMQDAYVRAYQDLDQFEGRAPFPTGLTRIAVHEALTRVRTRKRNPQLNDSEEDGELLMNPVEPLPRPEVYKMTIPETQKPTSQVPTQSSPVLPSANAHTQEFDKPSFSS